MSLNKTQLEDVNVLIQETKNIKAMDRGEEEENGHSQHDHSNAALKVAESASQGRFVVAGRDVEIGETLLAEKPYAATPYSKQFGTHCQVCLKRAETFLPCACLLYTSDAADE